MVHDLTLAEIKQFKMRDKNGNPTDYDVLTLEEALELTRGKILMNIDKFTAHPREILDAVAAVGALKEVLVKSLHDPDDARKFFGPYWKDVESGEILYMPVIQFCWKKHKKAAHDLPLWLAEEPRKASMYEICADKPEYAGAFADVIKAKGAPRLWINTMWDSLSAGHGDERALLDSDANWGWVLEQGASMIQTDYAAELLVYLMRKGRRSL
jgi:glycerophosphoryl diester phosphodiesterase